MEQHATSLPVDIVEHIISFLPYPDASTYWLRHKHTLLACALVCTAWTPFARRRLLNMYFPTGRIKIKAHSNDALALSNVFQSPLCTFDLAFFKVLDLAQTPNEWLPSNGSPPPDSLFSTLLPLNPVPFQSLHTLILSSTLLPFCGGGNGDLAFDTPSLPILSQIKFLLIYISNHIYLNDIAEVILLCPSVEEVTTSIVFSGHLLKSDLKNYPSLPLPRSLRKLDFDFLTLLEIVPWMTTCQPRLTHISSLSVSRCLWQPAIESTHLRELLDMIGPHLEDLSLGTYDHHSSIPFTLDHSAPLEQFTKNTSLKRFTIKASLNVAAEITSYLLKHSHFAPELETLEIAVPRWETKDTYFAKLRLVDGQVHLRHSIRRVIISDLWGKWSERFAGEEGRILKCLPRCEEKGICELRLGSKGVQ